MEYEALQPVMEVMRAILNARIRAGMTQKMLAEKSEISQADISRLENGTRNSSMALLKRLAEAMESTLKTEDSRQKTVPDLLREPDLKGSFVLIIGKQRPGNRPLFLYLKHFYKINFNILALYLNFPVFHATIGIEKT